MFPARLSLTCFPATDSFLSYSNQLRNIFLLPAFCLSEADQILAECHPGIMAGSAPKLNDGNGILAIAA